MPTDKGLKSAWKVLTEGGHRMSTDVRHTFDMWRRALVGVTDDDVHEAAADYVDFYSHLQTSHPSMKDEMELCGGKRWPMVADVAWFLRPSARRAPPTPADLLEDRWWPPTGGTCDATQWTRWAITENRTRPHLEKPCRSAWHPHQRILVLGVRHMTGWSLDWPNPYDLREDDQPMASCGRWCGMSGPPATDQDLDMIDHYRDVEHVSDPFVAGLHLSAFLFWADKSPAPRVGVWRWTPDQPC